MSNDAPATLLEAVTYFADENVAHAFMANLRWPNGQQVCPKCGAVDAHYFLKSRRKWKCRACRKQFSLKVGTIFEDSPIKFSKWLPALWMLANCKNGISSYELARALGVTQKTAWFMLHRIRLAMQSETFEKMGQLGGTVEVDETYVGGLAKNMHKAQRAERITGRGGKDKVAVMGILERHGRDGSKVRAGVLADNAPDTLRAVVRENVEGGATVFSDGEGAYQDLAADYEHAAVAHSRGEYVRGSVHTNGIENFWALLKRSIKGTYVSIDPYHLFRYVDEQAFRFNMRKDDDRGRFLSTLARVVHKRLTYAQLTGADLCRRGA